VFSIWQSNKLLFIYVNKTLNTEHQTLDKFGILRVHRAWINKNLKWTFQIVTGF